MAVTLTTTQSGANADYMTYLWGKPKKTDRRGDSNLLDFALIPVDTQFVKLERGAYITLETDHYGKWFTGYITNDPEISYLGSRWDNVLSKKVGVWGYRYQATSDEYILTLKPIGVIPPFLNRTVGSIIKSLAERLAPGVFDVTNVDDGPLVAHYAVEPTKKFINVLKDLSEMSSYVFWAHDNKLHFKAQDDAVHGTITLDGNDPHFTPKRLDMRPSTLPIINDVVVLGDLEPGSYMHEYFLGTGLSGAFPLRANVYGVAQSVLLDEFFGGSAIDSNKWTEYDTVVDYLQVSNGFLNSLGGENNASYSVYLESKDKIPMEGRIRMTHGEWDILPTTGDGIICGIWTQAPNSSYTGCLYGLKVLASNSTLQPIVNGSLDATQFFQFDTSKRYIIRTIAEFEYEYRQQNEYSYIDSAGVRQTLGGNVGADKVEFHTIITEVDPFDGSVVKQRWFTNSAVLIGVSDAFGSYVPIASDNLHATVSGITISIPVNATLETATLVPVVNASFEDWYDDNNPVGWQDPYGTILKETQYSNSGYSMKMQGDGVGHASIVQPIAALLEAGKSYTVSARIQRGVVTTAGAIKVHVIGTGVDTTGLSKAAADLTTSFDSYEADLLDGTPLDTIPADLMLKIEINGANGPFWIDDLVITSSWEKQLIGPNEIDAMDGLAPIATIVQSNTGSETRDIRSGVPQYNPGQSELTFFKDSVTQESNVPPRNQLIRLSYRNAQAAVGRVRDFASVATEATNWGDDGIRSIIKSNLRPRPRTSYECELASAAIVSENSTRHYEGTYTQYSRYFTIEPRAGAILSFVNLDSMIPSLQAEQIDEVVTTLESDKLNDPQNEVFIHSISFGKPDLVQKQLAKFEAPIGSFQKSSGASTATVIDVTAIGTDFMADVTKPSLVGWDVNNIYMDAGRGLIGDETLFEIRYTDEGWGADDGKNLIMRTASRTFQIPRTLRGKVFFIRTTDGAGKYSRYSAGVHVGFPAPNLFESLSDFEGGPTY